MTKIDIYSGFLGAGKTTLIKKMIQEAYHGQKLVLIENEFGEIGIDGGFLQEAGINITEMNSGCICCSLVGDFGRALKKVIAEYAPDRILIEPSGVGKLSDVIAAVRKVTTDDVTLGNFVTVADASKCKMYMKNFGEFYNNQIETANTIILSRTQNVSDKKLDECVKLIREHNPNAVLVTTPWDQLTGEQLMAAMEQKTSIALELEELEKAAKGPQVKVNPVLPDVTIDEFAKCDMRVCKVLTCEAVKKSEKLLKFTLDDGSGTERTILSGIHKFYEPEQLVGKTVVAILNLPPRKMMGQMSNGMLLSAVREVDGKEELHLVMLDDAIPAGAKLC